MLSSAVYKSLTTYGNSVFLFVFFFLTSFLCTWHTATLLRQVCVMVLCIHVFITGHRHLQPLSANLRAVVNLPICRFLFLGSCCLFFCLITGPQLLFDNVCFPLILASGLIFWGIMWLKQVHVKCVKRNGWMLLKENLFFKIKQLSVHDHQCNWNQITYLFFPCFSLPSQTTYKDRYCIVLYKSQCCWPRLCQRLQNPSSITAVMVIWL